MRIEIFHDIVNVFGNVSNKKEITKLNIRAIVAAVCHMTTKGWIQTEAFVIPSYTNREQRNK